MNYKIKFEQKTHYYRVKSELKLGEGIFPLLKIFLQNSELNHREIRINSNKPTIS